MGRPSTRDKVISSAWFGQVARPPVSLRLAAPYLTTMSVSICNRGIDMLLADRATPAARGDMEWEFRMTGIGESGLLSTAGDVLITGNREGYLLVLDSFPGKNLVLINLGGTVVVLPITFPVGGKLRIAIASGNSMFVFGLRD